MEQPVLAAIQRASFTPLGWFEPTVEDGVPHHARQVILIGNAGPAMFARFCRERDPGRNALDDWTVAVVSELATALDATAVFPFSKPHLPFLTWARRAGGGYRSPLGLNIHPRYGLWHAYRAALLFPVARDLPSQAPTLHPCDSCKDKPCLSTCPVSAFDGDRYDLKTCGRHLWSGAGAKCMHGGCQARLACPVGTDYLYGIAQRQFFMKAFRATQQPEHCVGSR